MSSYSTILSATLPVFMVMGVGFLFARRSWLSEEVEVGVMRLGLNLLTPCLILSLVPGNPALARVTSALWAIGLGFGLVVATIGLAWSFAVLGKMRLGEGRRTFAITAGIQNYGFVPLPILIALFPYNPGPAGLVFVHGIGVELAMWTIGLWVMTGRAGLRSMLNAPFLSTLAALLLNYTGLYRYVPGVVETTMEMLGRCAIPMAVFMVGATIARFFQREMLQEALRVSLLSVAVRLGLGAALILLAAKFLPLAPDLQRVLVVQAAMPAAVFPIVLARLFGGQPRVAIQVVLATSLLSVITAPFIIGWGLLWVLP